MLSAEQIAEAMKMSGEITDEMAAAARERDQIAQKQLSALRDIRDTLTRVLDILERKL